MPCTIQASLIAKLSSTAFTTPKKESLMYIACTCAKFIKLGDQRVKLQLMLTVVVEVGENVLPTLLDHSGQPSKTVPLRSCCNLKFKSESEKT